MITIKWKKNVLVDCDCEEGDFQEPMNVDETFDVEKIELVSEDADNGDTVAIHNEGIVFTANSQWFEII